MTKPSCISDSLTASLTKNATGAASLSVVESGSHENRLEVYGTTGALMVEETGELWHSPAGSGAWRPVQVHQDPMAPGMRPASWSRGFAHFACDIVEALRQDHKTVEGAANFEDGYRVQLVLDAARASNKSGCWEAVEQEAGAVGSKSRKDDFHLSFLIFHLLIRV